MYSTSFFHCSEAKESFILGSENGEVRAGALEYMLSPQRPSLGLLYRDLVSREGRGWGSHRSGGAALLMCQLAVLVWAQRLCLWPATAILDRSASAHAPPSGGVSTAVSHQELWSKARPLHAVSSDGRCTQSHLRWDSSGVRAEWPDGGRFLKMYHSFPFPPKLNVIGS